GDFRVDAPEVTRGLAMVQIAVCTRAPATAARPVTARPRLRVYDNYSARHLLVARQHGDAARHLAEVRHHYWEKLNRCEQRLASAVRLQVELLGRAGGAVISQTPLQPGRWGRVLAELLAPLAAAGELGRPRPDSPWLWLHADGADVGFTPPRDKDF